MSFEFLTITNNVGNYLLSYIWLGVLAVFVILAFLVLGSFKHLRSLCNYKWLFCLVDSLGSAFTKIAIYFLATIIIGFLLSILITNPQNYQNIANREMSQILNIIFRCLGPLFFFNWATELFNIVKEEYNKI